MKPQMMGNTADEINGGRGLRCVESNYHVVNQSVFTTFCMYPNFESTRRMVLTYSITKKCNKCSVVYFKSVIVRVKLIEKCYPFYRSTLHLYWKIEVSYFLG